MRTFLALLAAVATLAFAATAQAGGDPSLTLRVTGLKVLFGHAIPLTGRIAPARAGRPVEVLAWPVGRSSPIHVATVTTGPGGRWSVSVRPTIATLYKARSGSMLSRGIRVDVEPMLSLQELFDGRLLAHAVEGRSLAGRTIELQQQQSRGGWTTIETVPLRAGSAALLPALPPSRSAPVRLALSINEAGPGYLGATSDALRYHAYALTLVPTSFKVLYGHAVTLQGRLWNGRSGESVSILAWPYGRSAPVHLATVTTGPNGRWSVQATPSIRTSYEASWSTTQVSPRIPVGVEPAAAIRELSHGRVWTQVRAGRSFAGRIVELQRRLPGGGWATIAKKPLGRGSATVFAVRLPASTLRVAMSVNEAGPGYLGTTTAALSYR